MLRTLAHVTALAVIALPFAGGISRAAGTVTVVPIARTGEASPDGNGSFWDYLSFGNPCLDDSGRVCFPADLISTVGGTADDEVLYRRREGQPLLVVAREGATIPGGTGTYGRLMNTAVPRIYGMNNGGRVCFVAPLNATPGGTADNLALYSWDPATGALQNVRKGDLAPGYGITFNYFYTPSINDASPATIAFYGSHGAPGATPSPTGAYLYTGGSLDRVCWFAQPAPDANGSVWTLSNFAPLAVRPDGAEIAFPPHFNFTTNGFADDDGILRAAAGVFTQLARGNQPAPGGGTLGEFGAPVYNSGGQAAFSMNYKVTSDGEAILRSDGASLLVARTGMPAPDLNGTYSNLKEPSMNDAGEVAFKSDLTGTTGGSLDDSGIYVGGATVIVVQVAHEDQNVPEGGGRFASFGDVVAINGEGQILFSATLRATPGGSNDDRGLYLWDPVEGLIKMLREGDVIEGRTVQEFLTLTDRDFGGFRSLNDAGECVAKVRFTTFGGDGVFLFRFQGTVAVGPGTAGTGASLAVGPNPMRDGAATIRFAIPGPAPLRVTAHDLAGRKVRTLFEGAAEASGALRWDGTDDQGRPLAAGV